LSTDIKLVVGPRYQKGNLYLSVDGGKISKKTNIG